MGEPYKNKKTEFSVTPVYRVEITGAFYKPHHTRDDGGEVKAFLQWMTANDIFPVFSGHCGGGLYIGLFTKEHADKAQEYLRTRQIEEVEYEF